MKKNNRVKKIPGVLLAALCVGLMLTQVSWSGAPLWTFEPLTATTVVVPSNSSATVQYRVTNQSNKSHTLTLQPLQGVTQVSTGEGICAHPFVLNGGSACILSLQINGAQLTHPILDGPVVCQQGSDNQCYRPSAAHVLHITSYQAITTLTAINPNTGSTSGATGVTLTGTGLTGATAVTFDGISATNVNVVDSTTVTAVTPAHAAGAVDVVIDTPVGSATLANGYTYVEPATLTGVNPSSGTTSGATSVTLTGTGLTGATAVTFGGTSATSVNVVNSTTVTAVTPAHAAGAVDVVIDTPTGSATLANGYTYVATAVGQSSGGGVIACLNGGLNNFVAATADNSDGIQWGGQGIATGATSNINGALNTSTIVSALGNNGGVPYAAQLCNDFEVDSQGNTPCQAGNACYNDWYLAAGRTTGGVQSKCLYENKDAIGGFSASTYWTSTEALGTEKNDNAYGISFVNGSAPSTAKSTVLRVRCVRAFTPFP